MSNPFFNLYSHGFARVAVGVPECRVADPAFNAAQTIELAQQAAQGGAVLVAFPELGLSAYTCDDLFHQKALLDECEAALAQVVQATAELDIAVIVGAPLRVSHQLFNCAVVAAGGRVLGVVPKSYLPNYGEFYEARQFSAADCAAATEIRLMGETVPFGPELLFQMEKLPLFQFHVEICEDVWVPIPPSSFAALAGATVLVNLSASNIVVGKSEYRHQLVGQQSARCLSAYMYTSAGRGESSTDLAWDGQALIYENGELLGESERFLNHSHLLFSDVDLDRLSRERMRQTTFGQSVRRHQDEVRKFRTVAVPVNPPLDDAELPLERRVARFPYVPADPAAPRRPVQRGLQHPGAGLGAAPVRQQDGQGRHRHFRRAGLHPRAAGLRPGHGYAGPAAFEHPGRHDAGLCHQHPHVAAGAPLDGGGGLHGVRDRHPPQLPADVEGSGPSLCRRQAGLRHHVRKRAGGRAHQSPVPDRELQRRHRHRHGRPERACTRLVHVWRGRPHVRTTASTPACPRR